MKLGGGRMFYVYHWSPCRERAACVLETVADMCSTIGTLCTVTLVAVAPQRIRH